MNYKTSFKIFSKKNCVKFNQVKQSLPYIDDISLHLHDLKCLCDTIKRLNFVIHMQNYYGHANYITLYQVWISIYFRVYIDTFIDMLPY